MFAPPCKSCRVHCLEKGRTQSICKCLSFTSMVIRLLFSISTWVFRTSRHLLLFVGVNRWVARIQAHMLLFADQYPPFTLNSLPTVVSMWRQSACFRPFWGDAHVVRSDTAP